MSALAAIPFPLRIIGVALIGLLLFRALDSFGAILIAFAIILWVLAILALFYDHGWLNALTSVPVVAPVLGFLTHRKADMPDAENAPRGELSDADRTALLAKARTDLAVLIGAEGVREQVELKLVEPARASLAKGENGFATEAPAMLVLVAGPRGVGKTTVARAVAQIYAGLGVIKTREIVTLRAQDLRSGLYRSAVEAGTTAGREALDGVLLLDDADWLLRRDSYGGDEPQGVDLGRALLDVAVRDPQRLLVVATLSIEGEQRLRADEYHGQWLNKLAVRAIYMDELSEDDLLILLKDKLSGTGHALAEDAEASARRLLKEYRSIKGEQFDNAEACRRLAEQLSELATEGGAPAKVGREHLREVLDNLE